MAIQYKLKNTNTTNEQGSILYIEDSTGLYGTDNLGGYGTPNADRNTVALFLTANYMSSKGIVDTTIVGNNPQTIQKFEINIPKDGWYSFTLSSFLVLSLVDPGDLQSGTVYYDDITGNLVVLAVAGGNILSTRVVEMKDIVSTDYRVAIVDAFVVYNNSKVKVRVNSQISNLLTTNVDFQDRKLVRLKNNYDAIRAILQGAVYEYCRGNKATAQKSIEFLNTNNYVSE